MLNALSALISPKERVVTIEDAAELQLKQPHVVRLETRPPNIEGDGAIRLVQYKMSLKGRAIPIQDEPDGDPLGGQEQSSCGRWESPCSKPNR